MIDSIDFKEEWEQLANTEDVKMMWLNIHLDGISGFIEEELFKEFRFTKRSRKNIFLSLGCEIFKLHYIGQEITFKVIAELLKKVVKTECEEAKMGKRRLQKILSELDQSIAESDELDELDEVDLYIKAMILDRELQLDLFDNGYTIAEIENITPEISYIMNQLRD